MTALKKFRQHDYSSFFTIDGSHPWKKLGNAGCVEYKVRNLDTGRVGYFNFDLAKEMGLIDKNHPHRMNHELEQTLLQSFNLRIINEYDIDKNLFANDALPNKVMATRYLQLQHKNKRGETSGDGRGIWNGIWKNKGITWDISSRGTGVTKLSPGAVEATRPLKTGCTTYGYGCGLVEIDELYASILSSELLHRQRIPTERVLCVIDHGNGTGIGVRAGKNLLRPAHIFRFLKSNDLKNLRLSFDYQINREINNKTFIPKENNLNIYNNYLDYLCESLARFSAKLDRLYVFAWLAWDGDNMMTNGGIIDYGSIRQFGLRHDGYRYDDVDRFSTSINEQKEQTKYIFQTFIQIVDYILSGKKRSLEQFKNHKLINKFEEYYIDEQINCLAWQIGFSKEQTEYIKKNDLSKITKILLNIQFLEKLKFTKIESLADGINKPSYLNINKFLRELPLIFLSEGTFDPKKSSLKTAIFSDLAFKKRYKLHDTFQKNILEICKEYTHLLLNLTKNDFLKAMALCPDLADNAEKRTPPLRPTGNAINLIVDLITRKRKRGLNDQQTQSVIDIFLNNFTFDSTPQVVRQPTMLENELLNQFFKICLDHNEDI